MTEQSQEQLIAGVSLGQMCFHFRIQAGGTIHG